MGIPASPARDALRRGQWGLPMRRRAILALQLVFFLRADTLVKRTARMAVPILIHFLTHPRRMQRPICLVA